MDFLKNSILSFIREKGAPEVGEEVIAYLGSAGFQVDCDQTRGLDHGTWVPLRFIYRDADIPVLQLSLPVQTPLSELITIGEKLSPLRQSDVLIIGSGNLVHNLSQLDFKHREARVPQWAHLFDEDVKQWILDRSFQLLGDPWRSSPAGIVSHPTLEHYAPLLVVCGAGGSSSISFPFEGFEH